MRLGGRSGEDQSEEEAGIGRRRGQVEQEACSG